MCIFLYIQLLMFLCVLWVSKTKGDSNLQDRLILSFSILWGLVFGFRSYDVGNDSEMYSRFYSGYDIPELGSYEFSSETTEYGFTLVANVLHKISDNPTFFFTITALFVYIMVYFQFRNLKTGLWGYLCFFIMSASFSSLIIAMRQSLAIAFILVGVLSISHVLNQGFKISLKNWSNTFVLVGIASFVLAIFIHRTTILLLGILVLASYVRFTRKTAIVTVFSVFFITVFFSDIIGEMFDMGLFLIGGMEDENVNMLAERYSTNFGESNVSLLKIVSWCFPMYFTVKNTDDDKINTFKFTCLMFAFSLYMLLGSATMVIRITMLFQVLGFGLFVPQKVYEKKSLYVMYICFTLLYFYSAFQTYERWIPDPFDSTLPFKFIWE